MLAFARAVPQSTSARKVERIRCANALNQSVDPLRNIDRLGGVRVFQQCVALCVTEEMLRDQPGDRRLKRARRQSPAGQCQKKLA